MNILICGATGFVGRHFTQALKQAGHTVIRAIRHPQQASDIAVDFLRDTQAQTWLPRLQGIDVVINTVGVLRNGTQTPMQTLHHDTPVALFTACEQAGIKAIVHVSALGVDSGVDVPYFATRLAAEAKLPTTIPHLCLRPSVIYGEDGASAKMFRTLAKLPLQVLPLGGVQSLQPVHINDICQAVINWLKQPVSTTIDAVGGQATTMRGMLDSYRQQMGHGNALHIGLPAGVTWLMAKVGDCIPSAALCSDTYAMMAAGNTADSRAFATLLGQSPRCFSEFIRHGQS